MAIDPEKLGEEISKLIDHHVPMLLPAIIDIDQTIDHIRMADQETIQRLFSALHKDLQPFLNEVENTVERLGGDAEQKDIAAVAGVQGLMTKTIFTAGGWYQQNPYQLIQDGKRAELEKTTQKIKSIKEKTEHVIRTGAAMVELDSSDAVSSLMGRLFPKQSRGL